jgi:hypothetical protein
MKSPFFDLSHIVIRTYRHLGEDIGVNEMRRFTTELTAAIQEIQKREPKLRWDSPVYKFIEKLTPPSIAKEDAASAPPSSPPPDKPPARVLVRTERERRNRDVRGRYHRSANQVVIKILSE